MKVRFRRQQPIGPYIADFFCPSAALVIELDGSQHADEAQLLHDAKPTQWLKENGYRVLRFWNIDVLKTPHMVMETVFHVLDGAPLPENRTP
jgi:very-short-patch-repair endonuclease